MSISKFDITYIHPSPKNNDKLLQFFGNVIVLILNRTKITLIIFKESDTRDNFVP